MVQNFHLPPVGFGPGTQTSNEGEDLQFMEMPQDMRTYSPRLPDVDDTTPFAPALALMAEMAEAADRVAAGGPAERVDLSTLDAANRALVAETLGEGEVAMKLHGVPALRVQESVFAGLWQITGQNIDVAEIAPVPPEAIRRASRPVRTATAEQPGPAVLNAPALLSELEDKSATPGPLHVINLTLLPHSEGDLAWLDARLGLGSTDILSRGYGNCRIRSTALPRVWKVQFFNSMDTLILDTFEVTDMPEVVLAATEDLSDTAQRMRAVLEAIR